MIPPGRLETAALALEAVLAEGTFYRSKETPRSATGPDLDHLLLGGEGRFGVITRATLRLMPRTLVEATAACLAPSAPEAIRAIRQASHGLAPVEARWDRSLGIAEARFMGSGAAARARRFGDAPSSGHEIIRGHLELAGSWHAWEAISPLRPQAFQLVAVWSQGAFGAVELETATDADAAAVHARAIGLTIVSPRRLRPGAAAGWDRGAAGLLRALEATTDPAGVFRPRRPEKP
jgi:FAD/FMN-containing dehydrogenase